MSSDGSLSSSPTNLDNDNTRPNGAQRAASEAAAPHNEGQSDVENLRSALERNWSTSNISNNNSNHRNNNGIGNGQQGSGAAASREAAAVNAMAQSWSEGFGEITSPWPSVSFDISSRRSSTGTVKNMLPPTHQRAASEGALPRPPGHPNQSRVSSAMHDAARLKDWSRVLEICKQDPAAASYIGPGGMTALHHVCDKRCPDAEVAEAVIRACPDALTSESAKGWLPLHYAGRFKCQKGVVKALLDVDPEKGKVTVSKPDRQRRTPLFYAVRYDAPVGVVPQLLRADPSVVLSGDQNLQSPLEVIWNDFAEKIEGRRLLHPFIGDTQNTATPEDLQTLLQSPSNAELLKNWNTANIFLKAAFGFPLSEEEELADTSGRKWRILHATAAVDCHFTLFHMARALYPEQAQEMDADDLYGPAENSDGVGRRRQTALHLAASSKAAGADGLNVIMDLLRLNPDAANFADEIDGSYPLHRIADCRHKQDWDLDGARAVYEANPRAMETTDKNGKFPLHRAAAAYVHQEDLPAQVILGNFLERNPAAASSRDEYGFQPLHLLAMNGSEWDDQVQAVYAAHEGAVTIRTGRQINNSLPIHLAAGNPFAGRSFIEKLVALNPRGVSQVNGEGKLPLHLACELGKSWTEKGTELIYDAFTQAVSIREENERHWMALHMASASDTACGGLIKKLVELYPEACLIADSHGQHPLHLACKAGKNWEGGLASLFDGNPAAIGTLDQEGQLPLYIAADKHIAASGGAAVLTTRSDVSTTEGLDTTEALAVLTRQADELDVLFNLVRADPTTLPERR